MLSLFKLLLLVAFIAGAVWFFRFTDTGREITPAALLDYVRGFDPLASRLVYIGVYIVGTVLLIPGTILSFVGALLFGVLEGTLYTWIGATIGATGAFFVAKALGRDFVDRLLGGRLQALDQRLREHGFTGLLILRLVPLFPFNGINFGCGLTAIRTRDYILATAIGIVPGVFVYQYLFATIGPRLLAEGMRWEYLWDANLLLALGLFVAFCLVGRWLTAKLKAHPPEAPARRDIDLHS
jgi:uncharacterized membrane protein YdjX (TVP38/TMEM64 family)